MPDLIYRVYPNAQSTLSGASNDLNLKSFDKAANKPALTASNTGAIYVNEETGTLFKWLGSTWVPLDGDVCNVRDYGAIGNGIADDAFAIQQCIDKGNTVYIPAGEYFCGSTLTVTKNNTTITGDYGSSVLIGSAGKSLLVATGTRTTTGTISQKVAAYIDNITLENLVFRSKHVFDASITLVSIGYVKNSQVKNCIYNNVTYGSNTASTLHGVHFNGFYNCKFLTNIFYGEGAIQSNTSCYGFNGLNDGSVAENGFSSGNICYDSTDTGMGLWTGCRNISIVGDTFNIYNVVYPGVGIDCAGVTNAIISDCKFIGGPTAIRITTNGGYYDDNISLNNNLYENQSRQAIQFFHEKFSCKINGGKIISTAGDGIYIGMQPAWIGYLQINNTVIEVSPINNAIIFDLLPGHQLNLETSNPSIVSGILSGYSDEARSIGDRTLGALKYSQNKSIVLGLAPISIAKLRLDAGFYKISGDYTYTGAFINIPIQIDTLFISQLLGGSTFERPYVVRQSGEVDFTAYVPTGSTGSITSFSVHRIC